MSYRNSDELKYFGSDFNKFVHEKCTKKLTCINIDTLLFKRSKGIIRFCEYKHRSEKKPNSQREILGVLAGVFRFLNRYQKN